MTTNPSSVDLDFEKVFFYLYKMYSKNLLFSKKIDKKDYYITKHTK